MRTPHPARLSPLGVLSCKHPDPDPDPLKAPKIARAAAQGHHHLAVEQATTNILQAQRSTAIEAIASWLIIFFIPK